MFVYLVCLFDYSLVCNDDRFRLAAGSSLRQFLPTVKTSLGTLTPHQLSTSMRVQSFQSTNLVTAHTSSFRRSTMTLQHCSLPTTTAFTTLQPSNNDCLKIEFSPLAFFCVTGAGLSLSLQEPSNVEGRAPLLATYRHSALLPYFPEKKGSMPFIGMVFRHAMSYHLSGTVIRQTCLLGSKDWPFSGILANRPR